MNDDQKQLQQAFQLHQQGRLFEAAGLYERLIRRDGNNFDALHFFGLLKSSLGHAADARQLIERSIATRKPKISYIENYATFLFQAQDYPRAQQICSQWLREHPKSETLRYVLAVSLYKAGHFKEAADAFRSLLSLSPNHLAAHNENAAALAELKRYDEALASAEKALRINPRYAEAFLNKGNILGKLNRYDKSIAAYQQALAIAQNIPDAHLGRANIFRKLKRYDDAIADYDKALALKPDLVDARIGRGNILTELRRQDEALAEYDRALGQRPELGDAWLGRGNVLRELKRYDKSLAAYDKAQALMSDPAQAWHGRSNVFYELNRRDDALAASDKALTLAPDMAEAWVGRGNALFGWPGYDEFLAAYDKALALKPDLAEAMLGRGHAFDRLKQHVEAADSFAKALAVDSQSSFTKGHLAHQKMLLCDWTGLTDLITTIDDDVVQGRRSALPFGYQATAHSALNFKHCAEIYAADHFPAQSQVWRGERYKNPNIRVGYLSGEFRNHVTSQLMIGVFELHDKNVFDVVAFDNGWDDGSELRGRINRAFDTIVDVRRMSDLQAATAIRDRQIDILVNLNGYFGEGRSRVFSHRPAPIQVSYLGFSATMGADYIDYILADKHIVPPGHEAFYTERIAYLPDTYQANDSKRLPASAAPTRADLNLPDSAFVFCCFSNSFKITPDIFDVWMRLLNKVDGSVLWLIERTQTEVQNLRQEATNRNVAPERLVFSPPANEYSDYLARYKVADLFLDTLPFNAGATASDALWAGLPLLTCSGETYTARMAGSLLHAIGVPELITTTLEGYEQTAVDLARHPDKLANIRRKLEANRLTAPLFDTKRLTRHIEAAYAAMYERHQAGLPPDHIVVPA